MTGRWNREPLRDLEDLVRFAEAGTIDWDWVQAEWDAFEEKGRVKDKVKEALGFLKGDGYYVGWKP